MPTDTHTTMWGSSIALIENRLSPVNIRILMFVKKAPEERPIQIELMLEDAIAIGEMLVATGRTLKEEIEQERAKRGT
jgi:hypothetical protein